MFGLRRTLVIVLAASLSVGIPSGAVRAIGAFDSPQVQTSGRPYSGDCSVVLPQADKLAKGLEVQKNAIDRTEAQIAAAKGLTPPPHVEVATPDRAKTMVSSLMAKGAELRARLQALELSPDASASRDRVLGHFDKIDKASALVDASLASLNYYQAMQEVNDLRQLTETMGTYLNDSGLGDMLAGELGGRLLGEALGGPAGILIFEASALSIEVGARLTEQELNASELRQAESTRDALKFQYDAMADRIKFMRENCKPESTQQSKSPEQRNAPSPPSSAKKGKQPKAGDTQASKGSGSKVVAAAALAGGATIGTLYGLKAIQNSTSNSLSGCDPSKAPINEINTYCFGSTRNTSLCNQYIGQYDKFCKSCGYSGFDANVGGCR